MTWNEIVKLGYDQFVKRNEDLEYVVRCKDCKHWQYDELLNERRCKGRSREYDDYCSRAERKEVKDE